MATPEPAGGGGNILTQRLGPLATWVWLLILTLVVGGLAVWSRHKQGQNQQAQPGQVAGVQDVPDIILQNYVQQTASDTTTVNVPPPSASPPKTPPPPKPPGPPGRRPPPRKGPPPRRPPRSFRIVTVSRWTPRNAPWSSTLSGIAEHYGVPGGAKELARLNHIKNEGLIHPGQKIRVPAGPPDEQRDDG